MVFKTTDDQIVKIERMSTLCEDASNCRLEVFEGAAHEVLMETDLYRDRAFSEVLEFFKTHP